MKSESSENMNKKVKTMMEPPTKIAYLSSPTPARLGRSKHRTKLVPLNVVNSWSRLRGL